MAKKSSSSSFLSPEKYIRQKSRLLPLFECRINTGWEQERMAQIVIARSHVTGNITLGFYLVDLGCLGVKDSFYRFNATKEEYDELIAHIDENVPSEVVDYNLVHNIIFGAVEFADEYEFEPCKEFATTQYILAEDDDSVPLVEIPLGDENGNPLYVNTGNDSKVIENQILKQLERTAGLGNFTYIQASDLDNEEEIPAMTLEEANAAFKELMADDSKELTDEENDRLIDAVNVKFEDICDRSEVTKHILSWQKELKTPLVDEITTELLGVAASFKVTKKVEAAFKNALAVLNNNIEEAQEAIAALAALIGETALVKNLRIENLILLKAPDLSEVIETNLQTAPKFPLNRLISYSYSTGESHLVGKAIQLPEFEAIFGDTKRISQYEMVRFQLAKLRTIELMNDKNRLEAFYYSIDESTIEENEIDLLLDISFNLRLNYLSSQQ